MELYVLGNSHLFKISIQLISNKQVPMYRVHFEMTKPQSLISQNSVHNY